MTLYCDTCGLEHHPLEWLERIPAAAFNFMCWIGEHLSTTNVKEGHK